MTFHTMQDTGHKSYNMSIYNVYITCYILTLCCHSYLVPQHVSVTIHMRS